MKNFLLEGLNILVYIISQVYQRIMLTSFVPTAPKFNVGGQVKLDRIQKVIGDPTAVIQAAIKADYPFEFESMEKLLEIAKEIDNKIFKLSQKFGKKEEIDVQKLSEIEKIYHKIFTATDIKFFHVTGIIGKIFLFSELQKHVQHFSGEEVITTYSETETPTMPETVFSGHDICDVVAAAQNERLPAACAGDDEFAGGAFSGGFVLEETLVLQTLLAFKDFSTFHPDHPLFVKHVPNDKNNTDCVSRTKFSENPIIYKVKKVFDFSTIPYGKLWPVILASSTPELMSQFVKVIDPHPVWVMNFSMPDLTRTTLVKEIVRETLNLMFRAICLNLTSLAKDPEYKDSKIFQMILFGTGVFKWPIPMTSVMLCIATEMAQNVTEIRNYRPTIAAFNEAQAKEVTHSFDYLPFFNGESIDIVITRLFNFYESLITLAKSGKKLSDVRIMSLDEPNKFVEQI